MLSNNIEIIVKKIQMELKLGFLYTEGCMKSKPTSDRIILNTSHSGGAKINLRNKGSKFLETLKFQFIQKRCVI